MKMRRTGHDFGAKAARAPLPDARSAIVFFLYDVPGRSPARPAAVATAWAPALQPTLYSAARPGNADVLAEHVEPIRPGFRYASPLAWAFGLPASPRELCTEADDDALHATTDAQTSAPVVACKALASALSAMNARLSSHGFLPHPKRAFSRKKEVHPAAIYEHASRSADSRGCEQKRPEPIGDFRSRSRSDLVTPRRANLREGFSQGGGSGARAAVSWRRSRGGSWGWRAARVLSSFRRYIGGPTGFAVFFLFFLVTQTKAEIIHPSNDSRTFKTFKINSQTTVVHNNNPDGCGQVYDSYIGARSSRYDGVSPIYLVSRTIYGPVLDSCAAGKPCCYGEKTEYQAVTISQCPDPNQPFLDENGTYHCEPVCNPEDCSPPNKHPLSIPPEQCSGIIPYQLGYISDLEIYSCCDQKFCYGTFNFCSKGSYYDAARGVCVVPEPPSCSDPKRVEYSLGVGAERQCYVKFVCGTTEFPPIQVSCGKPSDAPSTDNEIPGTIDLNIKPLDTEDLPTDAEGSISQPEGNITSTTVLPDGTTKTTTTETKTNPDGSTTTVTTVLTTHPDGSTSTETTTTNSTDKPQISIDLFPITSRMDAFSKAYSSNEKSKLEMMRDANDKLSSIDDKLGQVIDIMLGENNLSDVNEDDFCSNCPDGSLPTFHHTCQYQTYPYVDAPCPTGSSDQNGSLPDGADRGDQGDENGSTTDENNVSGLSDGFLALGDEDIQSTTSMIDFLENLKEDYQKIEQDFNHTMAILSNKPHVNLHASSSTCVFSVTLYHHKVEIDPCARVAPYRSIFTIFFTLLGTFQVLVFAVKYLVSRRS